MAESGASSSAHCLIRRIDEALKPRCRVSDADSDDKSTRTARNGDAASSNSSNDWRRRAGASRLEASFRETVSFTNFIHFFSFPLIIAAKSLRWTHGSFPVTIDSTPSSTIVFNPVAPTRYRSLSLSKNGRRVSISNKATQTAFI